MINMIICWKAMRHFSVSQVVAQECRNSNFITLTLQNFTIFALYESNNSVTPLGDCLKLSRMVFLWVRAAVTT